MSVPVGAIVRITFFSQVLPIHYLYLDLSLGSCMTLLTLNLRPLLLNPSLTCALERVQVHYPPPPPLVSPGADDQHHQCTKAIIPPHFSSIEPDRPVDQPQQAADPNSSTILLGQIRSGSKEFNHDLALLVRE